jgi:hypothetical protein
MAVASLVKPKLHNLKSCVKNNKVKTIRIEIAIETPDTNPHSILLKKKAKQKNPPTLNKKIYKIYIY